MARLEFLQACRTRVVEARYLGFSRGHCWRAVQLRIDDNRALSDRRGGGSYNKSIDFWVCCLGFKESVE